VGAITAAAATARLIAELAPSRVLFLGTCGAYDERLAIGDLIAVSSLTATSLDEQEGRAYRPSIERTQWESTWPLPFPAFTVAVVPAITRTEAGARRLADLATAEHLELGGVFAACALAQVPVAALLAVANRVGPEAHAEWAAHHESVSAQLVFELRARHGFDLREAERPSSLTP
jgi:nucleoside phosphorylase